LGVAAVTIHGRTRQQGFSGTVDLDGIAATVAAAEGLIPVVGNGDVRSAADALHMRRVTGCDAVAIGRGAMLDPWIFRKIADAEAGRDSPDPTAEELIAFLVRHVTLMHEQLGEYGCVEFRKFAAWYGARLGIPEDLEDRLRRIESLEQFEAVVAEIRDRHGERQSSVPTALIRTPNGPVERW
ncbi:MAG: tRNA-dihydrouridine synthase, partial [Planctomycetota bacterium]